MRCPVLVRKSVKPLGSIDDGGNNQLLAVLRYLQPVQDSVQTVAIVRLN